VIAIIPFSELLDNDIQLLVSSYLDAVSQENCPRLSIARKANLTFNYLVTHWHENDGSACARGIASHLGRNFKPQDFFVGVRNGACANYFFANPEPSLCETIEQVHCFLKLELGRQGLLVGKFWPGENSVSKAEGRLIPNCPLGLISVRPYCGRTDDKFFDVSPDLLPIVQSGAKKFRELGQ